MGERGLQIIKLVTLLVVLVLVIVTLWGVFRVKSEVESPTGVQKLVGTGLCGTKPAPVFPWPPFNTAEMFTTTKFFMNNPDSVGNITVDKWYIYLEDETEVYNQTAEDIKTPHGEDNILTPHEIWEIDLMVYIDPTQHYEMYTLEVFWHADEGCQPLTGYGLQVLVFIDEAGTVIQVVGSQERMVNVLQVLEE